MHNNLQDNQSFIADAKARELDTLAYHDTKSQEFMLVAGHPESIKLLNEILDDYEMVCAVVAAIDTGILERWRLESSESSDEHRALKPENINSTKSTGENEHAQ
ncbi:hypothetical protein [Acidithiobacillus ferriphilus]|uniref:hypothetical protein n=1 Tax=Acidithiobacillus ferriphilus TaxID=1689834 RepID=UPI002DB98BF2|nr:hypothetical protein [Acidithiobacillus ferriphilus]MEB8476595.1 hypothetical protein [Acidithiobacillus ferriphilus]